jgi:hypothetical protein
MKDNDYSSLSNRMANRSRKNFELLKPCPICGKMLKKSELIKTTVYPGKPDRIVHMFGCPHCYPGNSGSPRKCPVCGKILGFNDYLIARMFERRDKKHVHVLGCTRCRDDRSSVNNGKTSI